MSSIHTRTSPPQENHSLAKFLCSSSERCLAQKTGGIAQGILARLALPLKEALKLVRGKRQEVGLPAGPPSLRDVEHGHTMDCMGQRIAQLSAAPERELGLQRALLFDCFYTQSLGRLFSCSRWEVLGRFLQHVACLNEQGRSLLDRDLLVQGARRVQAEGFLVLLESAVLRRDGRLWQCNLEGIKKLLGLEAPACPASFQGGLPPMDSLALWKKEIYLAWGALHLIPNCRIVSSTL